MNRLDKFLKIIQENDIDNFLLSSTVNIYYFTGFYPSTECYLLYDKDNGFEIFVTSIDYMEANNKLKGILVNEAPLEKTLIEYLRERLNDIKGKLYFEYSNLNYSNFDKLFNGKKENNYFNGDKIIASMREIKDKSELNLILKSAKIAEKGVGKALEVLREGISEIEVASEAEYTIRKAGAEGFAFESLIVSGKRAAWPHAKSSTNLIRKKEMVIVDLGCKYEGYCSDITRTFIIGKADEKQRKIYEIVKKAQELAINKIREGVPVDVLDLTARNFFKEKGYEKYFIHSLGHGVGLEVHEAPSLSFRFSNKILEGNVVTVEPGLYVPDWGGIRIEDMVLVEKTGYKLLTEFNKEYLEK